MSFLHSFFRPLAAAAGMAAIMAATAPAPAMAQGNALTPAQRSEVQSIIKDMLKKNPELVRDALIEYERRAKAEEAKKRTQAITDLAPKIFNSKYQVVLGNPEGKIQVVEFFDYNCGYCRRAMGDLAKIIKNNKDVRVVLKEFPVLGPQSVQAAQVASALHMQFDGKKYWDFHQRLMNFRGRVGKAQAMAAAKAAGADMKKLEADLKSAEVNEGLKEVMNLANVLGLTGTPSYVVGNEVVIGAVGYGQLQGKLNNIRKCGKASCS